MAALLLAACQSGEARDLRHLPNDPVEAAAIRYAMDRLDLSRLDVRVSHVNGPNVYVRDDDVRRFGTPRPSEVWLHVAPCDVGYLVATVSTRTHSVQRVRTEGGCSLPGI
jgi:hypothetical protein